MSNIIMCDFCGNITGGAAAQIAIRMDNSRKVEFFARLTDNTRYLNRDEVTYTNSLVKDACGDCLDKFLVTPQIKMLGGHPFKDGEDAPAGTPPE